MKDINSNTGQSTPQPQPLTVVPVLPSRAKPKSKKAYRDFVREKSKLISSVENYIDRSDQQLPSFGHVPSLEYDSVQEIAYEARRLNSIDDRDAHAIAPIVQGRFTVIPVTWNCQCHGDAVHLHVKETDSSWFYINTNCSVPEFRYWIAYMYGFSIGGDLCMKDRKEFGDRFAKAYNFPAGHAGTLAIELNAQPNLRKMINVLERASDKFLLPPDLLFHEAQMDMDIYGEDTLKIPSSRLKSACRKFKTRYAGVRIGRGGDEADLIEEASETWLTLIQPLVSGFFRGKAGSFKDYLNLLELPDTEGTREVFDFVLNGCRCEECRAI